jgi:hypothetical protein
MASVVNTTITDSLARGLRKDADRRFTEALKRQVLSGQAKSMRGALKSMQKELFRIYGPGRVKCIRFEKKRACWMVIQHRGPGLGYGVGLNLKGRTATTFISEDTYYPVVLTEHFVERFLQTQKSAADSLVSVIEKVTQLLAPFYGPTKTSEELLFAHWTQSGSCWIATEKSLIIGEVPPIGEALLKTIIGVNALENPKRKAWEEIRRSDSKVSFRPLTSD